MADARAGAPASRATHLLPVLLAGRVIERRRRALDEAAAVSETAYELGVALGIAVLGSTLNAVYRAGLSLPADLPGEAGGAVRESLPAATGAVEALPSSDRMSVLGAAQDAFVSAMQATSVFAAVLVAAAAVVALRVIPSSADDHPARRATRPAP